MAFGFQLTTAGEQFFGCWFIGCLGKQWNSPLSAYGRNNPGIDPRDTLVMPIELCEFRKLLTGVKKKRQDFQDEQDA